MAASEGSMRIDFATQLSDAEIDDLKQLLK